MRKGFTLIELLIVIAILAILATVVVLVIDPGELLKQARDSRRISDLQAINTALAMYVATVKNPDLGNPDACYKDFPAGGSCFAVSGVRHKTIAIHGNGYPDTYRSPNGDGWIPVNFGQIPGGSPLSFLPIDPVHDGNVYDYIYLPSTDPTKLVWELNATGMESERYKQGGTDDKESTDGGNYPDVYEIGTDPGLDLE